ncbi:hypothetical protein O71_23211 [Pontibacter sp. BAB1700]|nr:hypothetical protein O71_23211 [Pontibacter sp. BAB1700]
MGPIEVPADKYWARRHSAQKKTSPSVVSRCRKR